MSRIQPKVVIDCIGRKFDFRRHDIIHIDVSTFLMQLFNFPNLRCWTTHLNMRYEKSDNVMELMFFRQLKHDKT